MFKQFCISESLKFDRYESVISSVMRELRKSLIEKMDFLQRPKSPTFSLEMKNTFQHFEKALSKSDKLDFSKFGHLFFTTKVPEYKDPTKEVEVKFFYSLNRNLKDYGAASGKNILINFPSEEHFIMFMSKNKEVVDSMEDLLVHELTHIVDPYLSKKTVTEMKSKLKGVIDALDNDDFELYYSVPWEKLAFGTQNVRRIVKDWTTTKEFNEIAASKDIKTVKEYFKTKMRELPSIISKIDSIKNDKDRRKETMTNVAKAINTLNDKYERWVRGNK
jgi:hypothetical protein